MWVFSPASSESVVLLLCWSSCSESDMRAVVIQQSLFSSALKPKPHYPLHRIHSFWTHSNQLPIRRFPSAVSLILEQETFLTDILTISQNAAKQMFGLSFQASACSCCVISLKPFSVFNSLMPLTEMMPWAEAFILFQLCPVFFFPLYYFYTRMLVSWNEPLRGTKLASLELQTI